MNDSILNSEEERGYTSGFPKSLLPPEETTIPLNGLFLDLLGCMDGSNPMNERKPKPMTGFSQILNMITETMEARNSNDCSSQQSASSSEPRIHEIFEKSNSLLLGNGNGPIPTPCPEPTNPNARESSSFIRSHHAQKSLVKTSNRIKAKIPPSQLPSRIPRRQDTLNCPNIPLLRRPAQRGLIKLSNPERKKNSCIQGDGYADVTTTLESFPQQIAEALKNYNQSGLPRNFQEIETVLQKSGYPPPSQRRHVEQIRNPSLSDTEAKESSILIGGGTVTRILNNIMDVAYRCCGEPVSDGICRYCSANCATDLSDDTENASEISLQLKRSKSDYFDCCTGDESGDDGRLWSSGPESDNEVRD